MFQSTPPHGGRLFTKTGNLVSDEVSIHAPAWGATEIKSKSKREFIVSIHAPAWGAT